MSTTTNFGDVFVTPAATSVALKLGHPLPGRAEAVLTYREAHELAEYLLRLKPPAAPVLSVIATDGGIFG